MTKEDDAQKRTAADTRKRAAPGARQNDDARNANGGLTGLQAIALWELILKGDGTVASNRSVKLKQPEIEGLRSAGLITIQSGRQKAKPTHGAKIFLTDDGWAWANRQGLAATLSRSSIAAPLLEALFAKINKYLQVHDLALDDLLRPRRADPKPGEAAPAALEERIRSAYLQVTRGDLNQYVRLALLRAQLGDVAVEAVDAELRAMQQRGGAVLYPMDDPQRIRPEDDVAALRVAGERRDLLCLKG